MNDSEIIDQLVSMFREREIQIATLSSRVKRLESLLQTCVNELDESKVDLIQAINATLKPVIVDQEEEE